MRRLKTTLWGLHRASVRQRIDRLEQELLLQLERAERIDAEHEAARRSLAAEYERVQWKVEQKKANIDRLIVRKMELMAEQDAASGNAVTRPGTGALASPRPTRAPAPVLSRLTSPPYRRAARVLRFGPRSAPHRKLPRPSER